MKFFQIVPVFIIVLLDRFATTSGEEKNNANEICPTAGVDGFACADCSTVVHCNKKQEGTWTAQSLGDCPPGKVCNKGQCVKSDRCLFPNLKFRCSTVGTFPDPGDCTKYHFCVPDGNDIRHYPVDCPNKDRFGYNPLTTFCGDPLVNGQCQKFYVPGCKFNFEVGVITANPTLYYECRNYTNDQGDISTNLYPYMRACENGKKFNLNSESCV